MFGCVCLFIYLFRTESLFHSQHSPVTYAQTIVDDEISTQAFNWGYFSIKDQDIFQESLILPSEKINLPLKNIQNGFNHHHPSPPSSVLRAVFCLHSNTALLWRNSFAESHLSSTSSIRGFFILFVCLFIFYFFLFYTGRVSH